jgi:FkbM family methyltransferase
MYHPTDNELKHGYTHILPWRYGQLLALRADSYISRTVRLFGEYSEGEVDVFRWFIGRDDVVIDAGALFGELTVPLARCCPEGAVYAFEPQRIPAQILAGNVQLNSVWNVDISKSALGAEDGVSSVLCMSPWIDSPWGLATLHAPGNYEGTSEIVRVRTIDGLHLSRIDFIKIDVEGFEPQVLAGARKSIEVFKPVLYIEYNVNRADIVAELALLGYTHVWRHLVPVDREPNFFGVDVRVCRRGELPRPSDMILAIHPDRLARVEDWIFGSDRSISLDQWLTRNGFYMKLDTESGL